jgi:hypothetical protein
MNTTWRQYYINTWNFDPESEIVWLDKKSFHFRYEKAYPCLQDPLLLSIGLKILARVECKGGHIDNYIVFARDTHEISIKAVHTVIYRGTIEDIQTIGEDNLKKLLPSRGQKLAVLSPEEHYVALQSFVANLISVGFLAQIRLLLSREQHIVLGKKILDGLYAIAPNEILQMIKAIEHEPEIRDSVTVYGVASAQELFQKIVKR